MSAGAIPSFDDYKPKSITVTGKVPNFDDYTPKAAAGGDPGLDSLKSQGFLSSMWNALISPVMAGNEMLTVHTHAEKLAQMNRAIEIADKYIHGTPEEKAQARDQMLTAIPGGSTVYKAKEGNYTGAAGDVAGLALLGGAAKMAGPALEGSRLAGAVVTDPAVLKAGRAMLPAKAKAVLDAAQAVKNRVVAERAGPAPASFTEPPVNAWDAGATEGAPVSAPVTETPGMALARESGGTPWADLSPADQSMLEHAAKSRANVAAQPAAQRMGPPEVATPATEPSVQNDPRTAAEILRDDMAAQRANESPPEAPPSPPIGAHKVNPPVNGRGAPLNPPMRQSVEAAPVTAAAAEPSAQTGPSGVPEPTALADLMRDVPDAMRKSIADANYRAVKEGGAAPETAGPTYEAANRAIKVSAVAKALIDNGVTYSDLAQLKPAELQSYIDQLSRATAADSGAHPGHEFSPLSIDEVVGQMRRVAEKKGK